MLLESNSDEDTP